MTLTFCQSELGNVSTAPPPKVTCPLDNHVLACHTCFMNIHTETATKTRTFTFIARHTQAQIKRSGCTRRAHRFEAPFVVEVRCPDCGEHMTKVDTIRGVEVTDATECNERCMGATTGGVCECRCKGENHGGRWA